jgi:succinate dehydrogenase/fumarate reductase flavoprotein subunit
MEMTSRALLYFAVAHQKDMGNLPAFDLREVRPENLETLKKVIPIVMSSFEGLGLDITKEPIPYSYQVAGTAGIFGAGARITAQGATSLPGLYAGGVCSDIAYLPGGHLSFCSVTGHWAGESAAAFAAGSDLKPLTAKQVERSAAAIQAPLGRKSGLRYQTVHRRLGELLMKKVGLVLHAERLRQVLSELQEIREIHLPRLEAHDHHELAKVWGLAHYTQVLDATLRAYLYRTESRVAFIREDFPVIDNVNWVKMVVIRKDGAQLKLWDEPLPESFHLIPVRPTQNLHLVFRNKDTVNAPSR